MVGLSSLREPLGSTRNRGGRLPVGTWGADRLYRAVGSRGEPALAAVDLGSPGSACVVLRSEKVPLAATLPPGGSRGATSAPEAPRLASPVTSYPSPRRCSPASSLGLRHTGPGPPVGLHPERKTVVATPRNPHTPCPALPAPDSAALQGELGRKGQLCGCTHQGPAHLRLRTGSGVVWTREP